MNLISRRSVLIGAAAMAGSLTAARPELRHRLSALTDEIARTPDEAIAFARQYRLGWIELRGVPGSKNRQYAFLPAEELREAAAVFAANRLRVSFLNTNLMKFAWPGMPVAEKRPMSRLEEAERTRANGERFERRLADLKMAMDAAEILGVRKIRVFAGVRTEDPQAALPRVAAVLGEMGEAAGARGMELLVENEGSCNIATSEELAQLMERLPMRSIGINWDPTNAFRLGEVSFPDGYRRLPLARVGNVQIKGKALLDYPEKLDWKSILLALHRDGYRGNVGLETHIFGAALIESAHASMTELQRIATEI